MRSESEIKSRVVELLVQELDRRVTEASQRIPHLCANHYQHQLDSRKNLDGVKNLGYNRITVGDDDGVTTQRIGLCLLGSEDPGEWSGTICEEPIDAKKCSSFTPIKGKAELIPDLEADLRDLAWIRDNMPELHALLWVLHTEITLRVPWWKRLLFKLKVISIEPVLPPIDPSVLLPPVA